VAGSEYLQTTHERVMHDAMGVKPKVQLRLQEVGDARNMEYLLREAANSK
jgi:hypothetical protein